MYIMASEPARGVAASDVEAFYADKCSPQDLADAYALAHNQFFWVEDNEYDFVVGSPEHIASCVITDEWRRLMEQYQERIFDILRSEGIKIPATGQLVVLTPFMKKYGYDDYCGWWGKEAR